MSVGPPGSEDDMWDPGCWWMLVAQSSHLGCSRLNRQYSWLDRQEEAANVLGKLVAGDCWRKLAVRPTSRLDRQVLLGAGKIGKQLVLC